MCKCVCVFVCVCVCVCVCVSVCILLKRYKNRNVMKGKVVICAISWMHIRRDVANSMTLVECSPPKQIVWGLIQGLGTGIFLIR